MLQAWVKTIINIIFAILFIVLYTACIESSIELIELRENDIKIFANSSVKDTSYLGDVTSNTCKNVFNQLHTTTKCQCQCLTFDLVEEYSRLQLIKLCTVLHGLLFILSLMFYGSIMMRPYMENCFDNYFIAVIYWLYNNVVIEVARAVERVRELTFQMMAG